MCKAHPPRDTDLAETFVMRYVFALGKFGFFAEKITQNLVDVKLPLVVGKLSRQPVLQQAFLMSNFWSLLAAAFCQMNVPSGVGGSFPERRVPLKLLKM